MSTNSKDSASSSMQNQNSTQITTDNNNQNLNNGSLENTATTGVVNQKIHDMLEQLGGPSQIEAVLKLISHPEFKNLISLQLNQENQNNGQSSSGVNQNPTVTIDTNKLENIRSNQVTFQRVPVASQHANREPQNIQAENGQDFRNQGFQLKKQNQQQQQQQQNQPYLSQPYTIDENNQRQNLLAQLQYQQALATQKIHHQNPNNQTIYQNNNNNQPPNHEQQRSNSQNNSHNSLTQEQINNLNHQASINLQLLQNLQNIQTNSNTNTGVQINLNQIQQAQNLVNRQILEQQVSKNYQNQQNLQTSQQVRLQPQPNHQQQKQQGLHYAKKSRMGNESADGSTFSNHNNISNSQPSISPKRKIKTARRREPKELQNILHNSSLKVQNDVISKMCNLQIDRRPSDKLDDTFDKNFKKAYDEIITDCSKLSNAELARLHKAIDKIDVEIRDGAKSSSSSDDSNKKSNQPHVPRTREIYTHLSHNSNSKNSNNNIEKSDESNNPIRIGNRGINHSASRAQKIREHFYGASTMTTATANCLPSSLYNKNSNPNSAEARELLDSEPNINFSNIQNKTITSVIEKDKKASPTIILKKAQHLTLNYPYRMEMAERIYGDLCEVLPHEIEIRECEGNDRAFDLVSLDSTSASDIDSLEYEKERLQELNQAWIKQYELTEKSNRIMIEDNADRIQNQQNNLVQIKSKEHLNENEVSSSSDTGILQTVSGATKDGPYAFEQEIAFMQFCEYKTDIEWRTLPYDSFDSEYNPFRSLDNVHDKKLRDQLFGVQKEENEKTGTVSKIMKPQKVDSKKADEIQNNWIEIRSWIGLLYRYGKEARDRCDASVSKDLQKKSQRLIELDAAQFYARICRIAQDHMIALKAGFLRQLSIYREIIKSDEIRSDENSPDGSGWGSNLDDDDSIDPSPGADDKSKELESNTCNEIQRKYNETDENININKKAISIVKKSNAQKEQQKRKKAIQKTREQHQKTNIMAELFLKDVIREIKRIESSALKIQFLCPNLVSHFLINFSPELNWTIFNLYLFHTIVLRESGIQAVFNHGLLYVTEFPEHTNFTSNEIYDAKLANQRVEEATDIWRGVHRAVTMAVLRNSTFDEEKEKKLGDNDWSILDEGSKKGEEQEAIQSELLVCFGLSRNFSTTPLLLKDHFAKTLFITTKSDNQKFLPKTSKIQKYLQIPPSAT